MVKNTETFLYEKHRKTASKCGKYFVITFRKRMFKILYFDLNEVEVAYLNSNGGLQVC